MTSLVHFKKLVVQRAVILTDTSCALRGSKKLVFLIKNTKIKVKGSDQYIRYTVKQIEMSNIPTLNDGQPFISALKSKLTGTQPYLVQGLKNTPTASIFD